MQNQTPSRISRRLRSALLGGTALALVFGGAVVGGSLNPAHFTPAYAEPVQVNGIEPPSFADVVDQVTPAVVSVRVKSKVTNASDDGSDGVFPFFDLPPNSQLERRFRDLLPRYQQPRSRTQMSLGSGFFISEDGYIVTNNHVVEDQESVTVTLKDGSELTAKVIGTDPKTDLALLKVEPKSGEKFTYVKFADTAPRVGDWVLAVGNPFGLEGTVTAGIVSAQHRQINAGPYDDFLQIDAPVNRGNSGGPAFNYKGEVVGVNTAIASPGNGGSVGIAFAIPSTSASRIIDAIKKDGKVVRGYLGLQIQGLTPELADSLKLDSTSGAVVGDVVAGTPAAKAGLKYGDVILSVDGQSIKDATDLSSRIAAIPPGTSVKLEYLRDGKKEATDVVLAKLPSDTQVASNDTNQPDQNASDTPLLDGFGLSLDLSRDSKGIVVSDVDPSGQAAERGIQPGDVVLSVGFGSGGVDNVSDVEKKIADAKAGGLKSVALRLQRGDQKLLVPLSFTQS
jgi:serine protease Do